MFNRAGSGNIILIFFLAITGYSAQTAYTFSLTKTIEECAKARVILSVSSTQLSDSASISWSTGTTSTFVTQASQFFELDELSGGNYSAHIHIKHYKDSLINTKDTTFLIVQDTTISFAIDKEECKVLIEKYFSPNGDNYNDVLGIANIENYPEFELEIFNKWGQRVHHQMHKYEPWDGTWLNIALPEGVYYCVFFYDASNRKHLVRGDVTILR